MSKREPTAHANQPTANHAADPTTNRLKRTSVNHPSKSPRDSHENMLFSSSADTEELSDCKELDETPHGTHYH